MTAMITDSIRDRLQDRMKHVIELHFDPHHGSAYWIEKSGQMGVAPHQLKTLADLALLGPMDEAAMSARPIEDFVPRKLHAFRLSWILSETGGTLGRSKFSVHGQAEFQEAFVAPFVAAATKAGFPTKRNWLFIGPSGPHIIGKAARACANVMQSADPFAIDFDPRWARKLPADSLARQRYLSHLEEQALNILNTQDIGVLFATPPVLSSLAEKIDTKIRQRIQGIHFGGMVVSHELRAKLSRNYPNALQISGYGNSLLGVAPELHYDLTQGIDYYAQGVRLVYQIIPFQQREVATVVPYGERGRLMAHRFDETQLIINLIERDSAIRIPPRQDAATLDFVLDGLRDPQPIRDAETQPVSGLY